MDLSEWLHPVWGAEKWIVEGWTCLTEVEKAGILERLEALFQNGLPFKLTHSKQLYIYTFCFLAQLEVLAIQVPMKAAPKLTCEHLKARLREQLCDEVFHGLVFTKIVYMLCEPHAMPPAYNPHIETLCDMVRDEPCHKMSLLLLNFIGECWIETIFSSLAAAGIAPNVFEHIIADEARHVDEAELYQALGMPDELLLKQRVAELESYLITHIFMQYKPMISIGTLLGLEGYKQFIAELQAVHLNQLHKIGLEPSLMWTIFMSSSTLLPQIYNYFGNTEVLPMTHTRQFLMTQWDNPSDPTMVGQFHIDVTCLDFFNKKYPSETLTTLMLQTVSRGLYENPGFRTFLHFNQYMRTDDAYVGLVVKLPNTPDQLATIVLKNCHEMHIEALASDIRDIVTQMQHCYAAREALEAKFPDFKQVTPDFLNQFLDDAYGYPIPGNPFVSVSNIGFCGYTQCASPLRRTEPMKFTLMQVERVPVWDATTGTFIPRDRLPVSISADHRLFDGNLPVPKMTAAYFEQAFKAMLLPAKANTQDKKVNRAEFISLLDEIAEENPALAYRSYRWLQTYWLDLDPSAFKLVI